MGCLSLGSLPTSGTLIQPPRKEHPPLPCSGVGAGSPDLIGSHVSAGIADWGSPQRARSGPAEEKPESAWAPLPACSTPGCSRPPSGPGLRAQPLQEPLPSQFPPRSALGVREWAERTSPSKFCPESLHMLGVA